MRSRRLIQLLGLALPFALSLAADPIVINFEGLPDSTTLSNQYPGLTFSNAIVLTKGIGLNEFEFPPHSGVNVASENGGPISINFLSPVFSFEASFTYVQPLTLTAFGNTNNVVGTAHSLFSNNVACLAGPPCLGDPGSSPNELIQLSSGVGISQVTISGASVGGSFVLDDMTYKMQVNVVPEPQMLMAPLVGCLVVFLARKRYRSDS